MEASNETFANPPEQGVAEQTPGTPSPPQGAATSEGAPATASGQSAPPTQDPATNQPPPEGEQPAEPTFEEQQAEAAALQSPAERQVVPEQRPQTFVSDPLGGTHSATELRLIEKQEGGSAPAMDQAAYDRANDEGTMKTAAKEARAPNLLVGQRVQVVKGDNQGRNAYVTGIEYEDAIQGMIAASGTAEARFVNVVGYIVQTRDGRTDRLYVKPDEIRPLEYNEGWGRGTI